MVTIKCVATCSQFVRVIPYDLIPKTRGTEDIILQHLDIMVLFPIQMQIYAPILRQSFPHEDKAFAEVFQKFRRFDLVAVARSAVLGLEV